MIKLNYGILIVLVAMLFGCGNNKVETQTKGLHNAIFTFNNALNKKDLPAIPIAVQAEMLKNLGYDGMEFKETEGLLEAVEVFRQKGLKIYANYLRVDIDQPEPYLPEWKEIMPKLEGTEMILWVHLHSEKFKPSDEAADSIVVPIIQELADLALPYGVKIAIYHHIWFLSQTAQDSYRIAQKADRENVGSVFNLCHFLRTDSLENLETVINLTLPKLFAVSISWADVGDTKNMDWDRLIQPLGQGTFDTYRLVEMLADKGYTRPIGIQCYNLKTPPDEYLNQSINTWKEYKEKYALPNNQLTQTEKEEGWNLLFDGVAADQWRGINKETLPAKGWIVENGELTANVHGGEESGDVGDIVTKKKYGKFILKWDWRMETKGGNSGLKYFVQEGIGDNQGYGYGLEYQLLDDKYHAWMLEGKMNPNDYHTVGSLYEIYPASADKCPSPLGLWNESMIVCNGDQVEHWLNGKKILEYDRSSDDFKAKIAASKFKDIPGYGVVPEGHLLLQDHGSVIHFRNIKIKELR